MKRVSLLLIILCLTLTGWCKSDDKVVVAYITSWTRVMPDPSVMTHINYAFGHVTNSFDGVRIDNEERLRRIVALKKQQPNLKVMLSVGGWGSGRFSEMAASDTNRQSFARDCKRVCEEFNLDGIDIDWEYPTQSSANISSSPNDTKNFTLLMRDLRKALGNKRLLTLASVGSAQYIDFKSCVKYLNFVNVMAYDMGNAPKHHAALYPSEITGWNTSSGCVEAHRKAGVPDSKIVLGLPFYGRGEKGKYLKYTDRSTVDYEEQWHEKSQAPYLVDKEGKMVFGIETPRSIAVKCEYIHQQGLRGAMYWEYADDNKQGDLQRAVWNGIKQKGSPAKKLVAQLLENQRREDISPDSFFYDVSQLRLAIEQQIDPTSRAVYQATLAHLLRQNDWRAQVYHRDTKSHPDSIQEWSREEYQQQSAELYRQTFSVSSDLLNTPTSNWLPLVQQGKDEKVFGSSMLPVIWQACQGDFYGTQQQQYDLPGYALIIERYRQQGLQEAVLRMMLDSLNAVDGATREKLLDLKEEYKAIPACALVYLRLADVDADHAKEWMDEALESYGKSDYAPELQNRLLMLQHPQLELKAQELYYPGEDMKLPVEVRNMQSVKLTFYKLPQDFKQQQDVDLLKQIRRQGTRLDTILHTFAPHPTTEQWKDTLSYKAPDCGVYAMVMEGTTSVKLNEKPAPEVCIFRTSQLAFFYYNGHASRCRVAVVDALTGQPQFDVEVEVYTGKNERRTKRGADEEYEFLFRTRSDARGLVEFERNDEHKGRYYVRLSRPGDEAQVPIYFTSHNGWQNTKERPVNHLEVFTDRSIYRPGQTVYVSGVNFEQTGWKAKTLDGVELKLTCQDANHQEVCAHTFTTDEFGVFQDSITLPKGGLPGRYTIRAGSSIIYIHVEEYRRPTFRVDMQQKSDFCANERKVILRGKATTYSGVPVSRARVTGMGRWQPIWRFYHAHRYYSSQPLDTIWTNESGEFRLEVSLPEDASKKELKAGLQLTGSVDVLSEQGETQSATLSLQVCSNPLRMDGQVDEHIQKEKLTPWKIALFSNTGAEAKGTVRCQLLQDDVEKAVFTLPSNTSYIPQSLADVPSGQYTLLASAEVNGDTASWKSKVVLYSLQDVHLPSHEDLWLEASDSCDTDGPIKVQVGSSLKDAWIYLTMQTKAGMALDTLLHVSDELYLCDLPYKKEYGNVVTIYANVFQKGNLTIRQKRVYLPMPDMKLRPRWDTFRDKLQPGQQEEWKLTLTRPDGTPAKANVMLSLYDASLDALYPHGMNLDLHRGYSSVAWSAECPMSWDRYQTHFLNMDIRQKNIREWQFSRFAEQYFLGASLYETTAVLKKSNVRIRGMASPTVFSAPEVASDNALSGQIAGLGEAESSDDAISSEEESIMPDIQLRANLQETAFFYPTLRTDEKGQVGIAFTLPEGLTSWHLMGLAHTQDLMSSQIDETIVAQKDLMAELSLPRYLRDGDEAILTASIRNVSDRRQFGRATWLIYNADNNRELIKKTVRFDLCAHTDSTFYLPIRALADNPLLIVQWTAQSEAQSDGERRYLPVLSQMQNVTETRSYMTIGDSLLRMDLRDLFAHDNPNAVNRSLTIEHVAHPLLLAIQSLPSMMAPVRQDALSLATCYYAGSIAHMIANRYPDVRDAINSWAMDEKASESPLVQNEELTGLVMQETPWVVQAKQQATRRRRLSSLLDEMLQSQRKMTLLNAVGQLQQSNGSFAWYPGMKGNFWVTAQVAVLLTRLQMITHKLPTVEREMLTRAVRYMESELKDDINLLKKDKNAHLGTNALRYLYVVLFSDNQQNVNKLDVDYLLDHLASQASEYDRDERAMVASLLMKSGQQKIAQSLMPRLYTLLQHKDGMYLDYPSGMFSSIDCKIQRHVQLMETIRLVEPQDTLTYGCMAEWLIKQKRTEEWDQPVQSADAIYALLQSGIQCHSGNWRSKVTYDGKEHILKSPQPFLPYVRESITPVSRPQQLYVEQKDTEGGLAWGAVFAQYQLPAEQVEKHREGMTIRRDVEKMDAATEGARLHVRYTITLDTDYEYVTLRAPRISSAEPTIQMSGYRWQSVGYYQALHDASTDYFFDALPKGTYVIEEDWLLTRSGDYVLPPATLQCIYAPEFQSTTSGVRFSIEKVR